MKSIKLLISKNGFEVLKIFMEEWYLSESIVNNSSEVDCINITKHPTIIKKINDFVYFFKNNLKEYDIKFLEMSLEELQQNNTIYCYILEEDNHISTILENHLSADLIEEFYNEEKDFEMEV